MQDLLEKWSLETPRPGEAPHDRLRRRLGEVNSLGTVIGDVDKKRLREHAMRDFQAGIAEATKAKDQVDVPEEDNWEVTYHNEEEKILGCAHYPRNCKLQCPQCLHFSTCRVCHEKVFKHPLPRFEVSTMFCMMCEKVGPVGKECVHCKQSMGVYYCDVCHIFTDPKDKVVYHCDKCGLCRVMQRNEDYEHCDKCDACMVKGHKCLPCSTRNARCPICGGDLFASRKDIISPTRCSHLMHWKCLSKMCSSMTSIPRCPVCRKSILDDALMDDITNQYEQQMRTWNVPEDLNIYRVTYVCNDCEVKTRNVGWNFAYKCPKCNHFNTTVVGTYKEGEAGEGESLKDESAESGSLAANLQLSDDENDSNSDSEETREETREQKDKENEKEEKGEEEEEEEKTEKEVVVIEDVDESE